MSSTQSGKLQDLLEKYKPQPQTQESFPPTSPEPEAPIMSTPPVGKLKPSLEELIVEPRAIEETEIPLAFLADLLLKTLYFGGTLQVHGRFLVLR